jgi:hypothetical protein
MEFKIGDIVTQNEMFNLSYNRSNKAYKYRGIVIGFEKTPLGLTPEYYILLDKEIDFRTTTGDIIKKTSIDPMWLKLDISAIRKEKLIKLNDRI